MSRTHPASRTTAPPASVAVTSCSTRTPILAGCRSSPARAFERPITISLATSAIPFSHPALIHWFPLSSFPIPLQQIPLSMPAAASGPCSILGLRLLLNYLERGGGEESRTFGWDGLFQVRKRKKDFSSVLRIA